MSDFTKGGHGFLNSAHADLFDQYADRNAINITSPDISKEEKLTKLASIHKALGIGLYDLVFRQNFIRFQYYANFLSVRRDHTWWDYSTKYTTRFSSRINAFAPTAKSYNYHVFPHFELRSEHSQKSTDKLGMWAYNHIPSFITFAVALDSPIMYFSILSGK